MMNRHRSALRAATMLAVLTAASEVLFAAQPAGATATIDEFPILGPGRRPPPDIAADNDGSIWFVSNGFFPLQLGPVPPSTLGHVLPSGEITEYSFSTTAQDFTGIVVGPDHNIWFGEWSNPGSPLPLSRIGRLSRNGLDFQEFAVPPSVHGDGYLSNPKVLVAGPDGNLWFTAGSDALGQITTTGAITMFYLPQDPCESFGLPQFGNPYGLTVGPDGALWLAAQSANALMRFDLRTHEFQPLVLEPCDVFVGATNVVTGADGNLWVLSSGPGSVYRVSPSGPVSKFSVPGGPIGIGTSGGFIFIARFDHALNEISRIDPSTGIVVEDYPIPTPASGPTGIAVDPAGNVWFVEQDSSKIGRLRLPSPCVDTLRLSYEAHTLNMHFALGTEASALWSTWLAFDRTVLLLWAVRTPTISPALFFNVPITDVSPVGNVAVLTFAFTSAGRACGDFQIVDTGGTGATADQLEQLVTPSLVR